MSVLEQLEEFEQSIVKRLRELAPLVREYQELRGVADRLGLDPGPDLPPIAAAEHVNGAAAAAAAVASSGRRRRRSGSERRQDQVLDLVRGEPGITVADIARRLDVDPTSLYRVVRKLESSGQIAKDGRRLHPRTGH